MASARSILDILERQGVTDVIGVPDNSSAALYTLLQGHPTVKLRSVTREGEAFAMAMGLWMGGRHPMLLIQNTGFFESGDALRGTLTRMRIPIVCVVTYRGYNKTLKSFGKIPEAVDAELLSRSDVDNCAPITEPTLRAWGLPYDFLHTDDDLPVLEEAFRKVSERDAPVAVLVTRDTT
jgi:sulfopyruvate decarboxylase TPP-binding subunit